MDLLRWSHFIHVERNLRGMAGHTRCPGGKLSDKDGELKLANAAARDERFSPTKESKTLLATEFRE